MTDFNWPAGLEMPVEVAEYVEWWNATDGWTRLEGAMKADAALAAMVKQLDAVTAERDHWRGRAMDSAEDADIEAWDAVDRAQKEAGDE